MIATLRHTLVGGVCGLLTRPCCVAPLLLSMAGTGGTALSVAVESHRASLQMISIVLLATSLWMTFSGNRPWPHKVLAIVSTAVGFVIAIAGVRML